MNTNKCFWLTLCLLCLTYACTDAQVIRRHIVQTQAPKEKPLRTGAERTEQYLSLLDGKRVGLVVNQTAVIGRADGTMVLLPDTLVNMGVDIKCIMAPEHGYRGTAEAGAKIQDDTDPVTGLHVYSLYGKTKKPQPEWLSEVDVVIFDIQDVGCRFYTYLSTLYYVLQACMEEGKMLVVFDRPNPKDVVDGPMLRTPKYRSFVGMLPIPLLHGCTLGELAGMMLRMGWVKPTKWTADSENFALNVIPCTGWKHGDPYSLPVGPSKNLQNDHAISLYPSLCLFEASEVSVGRGTDHPFEMFGQHDLRQTEAPQGFSLQFYLQHQQEAGWGWITRPDFFYKLSGSEELYNQLKQGLSEDEIRASWQPDLDQFKMIRAEYALYPIP